MRPLTDTVPKPLLRVGGKPLIEWHIERLAAAGVRDIAINTSHLAPVLHDSLGDGSRLGVAIRWFDEGPMALETAGGIVNALPYFADEPFAVVNGDVWTDLPLPPPSPADGRLAHLVLVPNPLHHPRGDFGLECGELRQDGAVRHTFSGIATYHPRLFRDLAPGRRSLKPTLDRALAAGLVTASLWEGGWTDVGTPARLAELDAALA
jgi:MurNAc alpha-1-phosphate uridylyltransferase